MTTKELSLYHLVREPKIKKEKSPVIIMLHGYGSDANDLFSFSSELPGEYYVISAQAPYPLPPYGNAWYAINFDNSGGKFSDDAQAIDSRKKIIGFIDEIIDNYPVDPDNITLLGFSQGSILSYAVALSHPEKIKNVIALSGYINEDILEEGYHNNDFSGLSIYASHGSQDQVIPVSWARRNPEILERLGIDHKYSEFPVGHGVAPQNFMEVLQWLKDRP
ncbi:alpha/beta fold hydrolase [Antarcticibacterium flavum]|uniref:Alpha/beta fold hydrolase n=1 Tax=Antarcticibacterium flavum TaxID=2058175 RepID=A0A5B7X797_9FLAO|nr:MULTISPECIES: alpha/beta fold hydrolase [Antarcticibacterium]MCM4160342.1 phospholipase [Antarcticibacterium sp. W02-3]QCY71279.1 alpha/beta fold hydrolase [Antarcticibacterium flavum]